MNDPFEKERQARFVQPMAALFQFVKQAEVEIIAAAQAPSAEQSVRLYDGAMDLLFNALNLANPVAHVRCRNGRLAFMWIEYPDKKTSTPAYRWAVCCTCRQPRCSRQGLKRHGRNAGKQLQNT